MSYQNIKTVSLGSGQAGKLASLGYTVFDGAGTPVGSRVTTGINEIGGGQYWSLITFPANFSGFLKWNLSDGSGVQASEEVNPLQIDMSQPVPITDVSTSTDQTLGDCLGGARAQAFGEWIISNGQLVLKGPDGSTVRTFNLNTDHTGRS